MRDIEFDELLKSVIQSALLKGEFFTREQLDASVAEGLRQRYDWVVALWPDPSKRYGMGCLQIIDSGKADGFARFNSIPCVDEATALHLQALCRVS